MLSPSRSAIFRKPDIEYPLVDGVKTDRLLAPLNELEIPDVDLSELDDVEGTQNLLREVGIIP